MYDKHTFQYLLQAPWHTSLASIAPTVDTWKGPQYCVTTYAHTVHPSYKCICTSKIKSLTYNKETNIWKHFQLSRPPHQMKQIHHAESAVKQSSANTLASQTLKYRQTAAPSPSDSRAPYLKHCGGHPVPVRLCVCVLSLTLWFSLSNCVLVLHCSLLLPSV